MCTASFLTPTLNRLCETGIHNLVLFFLCLHALCMQEANAQVSLYIFTDNETDTHCFHSTFTVLCTYIGANCHLIGGDDGNILASCIDQSDDTIHLLRYMHTKQQR